MRVFVMLALMLGNYVIQSAVFPAVAILGVTPDTALILIVSYGILRGDVEGALFGFACGLTHDVFGGYFIGLYAMLGMLTGYVSGKPFKDFFNNNYFLPFVAVAAATVVYQFMFYCAAILFSGSVDLFYYARAIILPKTIYTAVLSVPFYVLMYAVNGRVELFEYNRRNLFKEKELP